MPTTMTCAERISAMTLSAFHDGALTPRAMTHLRAHIATCAACQRQLADFTALGALLRRPAPALESTPAQQRRTWLAIRARITHSRRIIAMSLSRAAIWKGAGALVATALIAALIFAFAARDTHHSLAVHSTLSPSATPQPLTPEQAWGAQYIHHIALNDPDFVPTAFSPDGTLAVGDVAPPTQDPGEVAVLNLANGKIIPLDSLNLPMSGAGGYKGPITDGRYVAWWVQAAGIEQIMVFDLTTHVTMTLVKQPVIAQNATAPLDIAGLDHGYLLWTQTEGSSDAVALYLTNLATHQQTTVATRASSTVLGNQFVWPNIFYEGVSGDLHLFSVPSHADQVLPNIYGDTFTFTPDSLFAYTLGELRGAPNRQVEVLVGPDYATAQWHLIYTIAGLNVGVPIINGRLIAWIDPNSYNPHVWDLVLHREVVIVPDNTDTPGFHWGMFGKWLAYKTFDTTGARILNYIDSSQLPTK